MPVPAIVGSVATFAIWIVAMATHPGARYGGPAWLVAGAVVYWLVRKGRGEGLLQHVQAPAEVAPGERVHEHPRPDEARARSARR